MDQKREDAKVMILPNESVEEAAKFYQMIRTITAKGNDAEVKMIKGKLKIVEIRKQTVSEFEVRTSY